MARSSGTRVGNGAGRGPGLAYGSAGDGWGGAAKGCGAVFDKPALFTEGNAAAVGRAQPDTARAQELRDHLYTLAKTAERQETQVSATIAWLNRVEGMPTQRQEVNATIRRTAADFSDAELAAIAGEGEGAEGTGETEGGAL